LALEGNIYLPEVSEDQTGKQPYYAVASHPEDAEKVVIAEDVIKMGGQHPDEIPNPTIVVGLYSSDTNVVTPFSVSTNVDSSLLGNVKTEAMACGLNISCEGK
jgi:hypothetical protein